jgi:hypothetical protein
LAVAASALLASACASPGVVDGVVEEQDFSIRDDAPELRPQPDDGLIVVLSEEVGSTLRVVSLTLPDPSSLDGTAAISARDDADIKLSVAQGDLVEQVRSDGVRVLSTDNTRFTDVAEGQVTVEVVDGLLLGSLEAQLEDGGWLEGSFAAEL